MYLGHLQENDGISEHRVTRNKPSSERQIAHVFSHKQYLDLREHDDRRERALGGRQIRDMRELNVSQVHFIQV